VIARSLARPHAAAREQEPPAASTSDTNKTKHEAIRRLAAP